MVGVTGGSGRIGSPASLGMMETQRIERSGQMCQRRSRWALRNHPDTSRRARWFVLLTESIATAESAWHGRCAPHPYAGNGDLPHAETLACWRQNRPGCSSADHGHTDGTAEPASRSGHTSNAARRLGRARRLHGPPTLSQMRSCCPPSRTTRLQGRHESSKSSPPDGSGTRRRKAMPGSRARAYARGWPRQGFASPGYARP